MVAGSAQIELSIACRPTLYCSAGGRVRDSLVSGHDFSRAVRRAINRFHSAEGQRAASAERKLKRGSSPPFGISAGGSTPPQRLNLQLAAGLSTLYVSPMAGKVLVLGGGGREHS